MQYGNDLVLCVKKYKNEKTIILRHTVQIKSITLMPESNIYVILRVLLVSRAFSLCVLWPHILAKTIDFERIFVKLLVLHKLLLSM